jgi:hypothetical protein
MFVGNKESAMTLVHHLLQDNACITLELQQQMVDEKKDLNDTEAGKEVQAEIIKERQKAEKIFIELKKEHKEALEARDSQAAEMIAQVEQETALRIARLSEDLERTRISTQKLVEEKYEKLRKVEAALHKEERRLMMLEQEQKDMDLMEERALNDQLARAQERETAALEKRLRKLQVNNKPSQPAHGYPRTVFVEPPTFVVPGSPVVDFSVATYGNSYFFKGPNSTEG